MTDGAGPDAGVGGEGAQVDFEYQLGPGQIAFELDETLYPRDAVLGAAYLFVDRCYVFLTRAGDQRVGVRLRAKEEADAATLEALAGELANELLNQVLRHRLSVSTSRIRDLYMYRAFFTGGPSHSTIDALLAELDAEELEDDPLEIAVPWEEGSNG